MAATPTLARQGARKAAGDPFLRARDERLESLKAVVGKLAHDFNNFLVPQFGYITLLKEEIGANETAAQYLATMQTAARTTEGYIESVLMAMRPQRQYSPKKLELEALLNQAIDRWQAELPADLKIEARRQTVPIEFNADERHWNKVFEHLLSNARHALASGGTLEIRLGLGTLSEEDAARLGIESREVFFLRFSDDGFGMPEANLARAFEPFFTTRVQTRGSGLGLTIVHTVAHFYGGQVELESREDEGTVVTLWVPFAVPATARPSMAGLLRQRSAKKKKALLIEHDPFLREALRGALAEHDMEVHAMDKPQDAAKFLARDPAACALIVAEASLPDDRRGEGILAGNEVPCILLASEGDPAIAAIHRAGVRVLAKPISMSKLREFMGEQLKD
jgi:hypothetical protein